MIREQTKIAWLSQLGNVLESYYDLVNYPIIESKLYVPQHKKKGYNNPHFLDFYLRQYTQTMLERRISYYSTQHYRRNEPKNHSRTLYTKEYKGEES